MPIQTTFPVGPGTPAPVIAPRTDPRVTQEIIKTLMAQNARAAPVRHPLEGLGRVGQQLVNAYMMRRAGEQQTAQKRAGIDAIVAALRPEPQDPGVAGPARGVFVAEKGAVGDQRQALARALMGNEGLQKYATEAYARKTFPGVFDTGPRKRQIVKGADGYNYYADTGERVVPGVKKRPKTPEGYRLNADTGDLEAIPGGPADPAVKAELADAGRPADSTLVEIYDPNSPTGTRLVPRAEAAGQPGKPPSGLEVTTPGGTTIRTGVRGTGPAGMEKKTKSDLEGDLRKAREGVARLEDVKARFRPEFQQVGTRLGAAWAGLKAKFKGTGLPLISRELGEDEVALLQDFSAYRRDAIDNINRYIKEITGAQMAIQEAARIRKGMPDPGEGIFDGDDPVSFQSKLNATTFALKKAAARYTYALRNGLDPMSIDLDEIEPIMRQRMNEIEAEVRERNPNISPAVLDNLLERELAIEFGLTNEE